MSDEVAAHAARNRELVGLILKNGGDIATARTIDLHFWAPDEATAQRLADALRQFGVSKVACNSAKGTPSTWNVEAEVCASVADVVTDAFVERLVALATAHDSNFDGWGTSL